MTNRIRWEGEPDRLCGYVGKADPLRLTITGPVGDADWWTLAAWIPGTAGSRNATADNPEDLKATAERWLEEFVSSLGAIFPDELYGKIETERDARFEEAALAAQDDDDEGMERAREMNAGAGALGWALSVMRRMETGQ